MGWRLNENVSKQERDSDVSDSRVRDRVWVGYERALERCSMCCKAIISDVQYRDQLPQSFN
jgi:hypothetical protein